MALLQPRVVVQHQIKFMTTAACSSTRRQREEGRYENSRQEEEGKITGFGGYRLGRSR
jgi:hypothetical protein